MKTKCLISIAALLLLIGAYGISFCRMGQLRSAQPPETRRAQALSLDPTLLRVISGPFKGLMADYLNIKASVFMGGAWQVTPDDWEAVYTLLKQSLYLDPLFFQNGYYIQGLLTWRKGMHERAVELLQYHAEKRYWDWEPMFYVGFNHFFFLKDNEKAAHFMRLSAERPGAPPIAANLAVRLAHRSGQTLTAIALLKTMVEQTDDENAKEQYAKRLEAHLAVHQLEQAVVRFEQLHGRRPDNLQELDDSGLILTLPQNPFKNPFIYEPETGRVFFDEAR